MDVTVSAGGIQSKLLQANTVLHLNSVYFNISFSHEACSFVGPPGAAHTGKSALLTASRPQRLFRQLHISA